MFSAAATEDFDAAACPYTTATEIATDNIAEVKIIRKNSRKGRDLKNWTGPTTILAQVGALVQVLEQELATVLVVTVDDLDEGLAGGRGEYGFQVAD